MNKALITGIFTLALATGVLAANDKENMAPGMMMGMMNHEQMMQMQEHMQQMQKLMADIKMEHNEEHRMQMMNEHMKQMNETMGMMGGGMMGATGDKSAGDMNMQERMQMMQNQVGMMQMMMQQMMEHFSEASMHHAEGQTGK